MTDIANRTAFITGGANGIGLGIARALARDGARLALVDLDVEGLARAKSELEKITPVFTAVLDVRDRTRFAHIAEAAEAALGPVSILVNNAGVVGGAAAADLTYALWDWGVGINLGGVINGIQTFLPKIAARKSGGHIVNTASGAGLVPPVRPGGTIYTTSKYAVVGMSEALGAELEALGIGVTVLCPGPVATGIIARALQTRPGHSPLHAEEQRVRVAETEKYLEHGTPPDTVGDMVREAIRHNRLYVHTDRLAHDRIVTRTAALLEAMPPPT